MKRWRWRYPRWPKKRVLPWLIPLVLLVAFYCGFLNHIEPTQVGIARNLVTGRIWLQDKAGWHITPPWVLVAQVDTRPFRVSVASSGRGYTSKLVQFEARGWREFVETEGFRYYWWANRFSINFGHVEEYRGMSDILVGYAFTAKRYPFITVLTEYEAK